MSCIIVIPAYKKDLTKVEEASLRQCLKVLNKYDICFLAPKSLDFSEYKKILDEYEKPFRVEVFEDYNFKSVDNYSKLMLKKEVYKPFLNYDKMLIYQLDAWIFKDELEYWCNQPYDYIGAPWFEGFTTDVTPETPLQNYAGNGGFSLRSVDKMYKLVSKNIDGHISFRVIYERSKRKRLISNIINFPAYVFKWLFQKEWFLSAWKYPQEFEDVMINRIVQYRRLDWFRLAPSEVAIRFGFEYQPEVLYKRNNNELPFGCHAFEKYNPEFYKKFIEAI